MSVRVNRISTLAVSIADPIFVNGFVNGQTFDTAWTFGKRRTAIYERMVAFTDGAAMFDPANDE